MLKMRNISYTLSGSGDFCISKGDILDKIKDITERKEKIAKIMKALEQQMINLEDQRAELFYDYFDILIDEEEIDQDYPELDEYDSIDDFEITPDRKTRRDVLTAVDSIKAKKSSRYYKMRPRNPRLDRTKSPEKKNASKQKSQRGTLRCI